MAGSVVDECDPAVTVVATPVPVPVSSRRVGVTAVRPTLPSGTTAPLVANGPSPARFTGTTVNVVALWLGRPVTVAVAVAPGVARARRPNVRSVAR